MTQSATAGAPNPSAENSSAHNPLAADPAAAVDTAPAAPATEAPENRLRAWLLRDIENSGATNRDPERPQQTTWWRVMCLTGLDYFSTLGYQPGIAALAAGLVSPLATILLVGLTLVGALPVYRRVARESHDGQGCIAMLERLLPKWAGKAFVLVLLGFAGTDFMITITISAADATAHILENPYMTGFMNGNRVLVTLVLISLLGAVFLRGFRPAIGIAVVLVAVYLTLNAVVVLVSLYHIVAAPQVVVNWRDALTLQYPDVFALGLIAFAVFPKLALGLSGFETGAAVMPLIKDDPTDTPQQPTGRIQGTHRLLTTAAIIMSVFLITSAFATTLLIPQSAFQAGGAANGRALAFLAHEYLGSGFGSIYDIGTVFILWFAGASALAALLNLVPRYLPRYGMAPAWARAVRPLVLVFFAIALIITLIFGASVDAQGAAYATGVLFLITSAAFAVTISAWHHGHRYAMYGYGAITVILVYTTIGNIVERPDGVKIALVFIAAIVGTSVASRVHGATELRATQVQLDEVATRFLAEVAAVGAINLIANEPDERDEQEYHDKVDGQRADNHLPAGEPFLFLEVTITDPSDFDAPLRVFGEERAGYRVLRVEAPTIANAIAAVLLHIRDVTGRLPHVFFSWTEGNPVVYLLRYLFFGDGEIAPLTRAVLRQAEKDRDRRPLVHVG